MSVEINGQVIKVRLNVGQQVIDVRIDSGYLQIKYNFTDWIDFIPISSITGPAGREVEIQNNGTYIQWRYQGDSNWTNLIAITDLKGDNGIGIANISKTSTAGLVDTYTITYSDATTSTFTVTNGEDGTVLTQEQLDAIDAIELEGDGTKYLADDGTYKTVSSGGGLTPEQEDKLDAIDIEGIGDKYLANDGTYKTIDVSQWNYKGTLDTYADLLLVTGSVQNDAWYVKETDSNDVSYIYIFDGTSYPDEFDGIPNVGGTVDQTFDGESENAQSGVAVQGLLYGDGIFKEYGIDFSDTSNITPRAASIIFLVDKPIKHKGRLTRIRLRTTAPVSNAVIIKRFKNVGDTLMFVEHFGYAISPTTNINIDLTTQAASNSGKIENFIFDEGDIIAVYQNGTNWAISPQYPEWDSYHFSTTYGNAQTNIDISDLTHVTNGGVMCNFDIVLEHNGLVDELKNTHIDRVYNLPLYEKVNSRVYDTDRVNEKIFDGTKWNPTSGSLLAKDRGLVFDWNFTNNASIEKSTNFNATSETFTPNTSYAITVGNSTNTNQAQFIRFKDFGMHLYEFQKDVIEFTLNSFGTTATATNRIIGILYEGATISRKVNAFGGINQNGAVLRTWIDGYTNTSAENIIQAITINVGRKYRIEHFFFGGGRCVRLYDVTSIKTLIGEAITLWPPGSSGAYAHRPNNRNYALALNDISVTITKMQIYNLMPMRSDVVVVGDSISVSRTATAYDKGFGKLTTEYCGVGSMLVGGGSNTIEDIVNILPDILEMKPKKIVVAIGTNDCSLGKANRYDKYIEMLQALDGIIAEVIICNVIPSDNMVNVIDFNDWINTEFGSSYTIVDNFTALANVAGDGWNTALRADNLHPNDAGHLVMFNNIKPHL